jgi:hypothetical protein
MKANMFLITAIMLIFAGYFISCKEKVKDTLFHEPIDISYTDYVL